MIHHKGNLTLLKVIIENVIKNTNVMHCLFNGISIDSTAQSSMTRNIQCNWCALYPEQMSLMKQFLQWIIYTVQPVYSDSWVNDFYELGPFSESNTYSTTNIIQFPTEWLSWVIFLVNHTHAAQPVWSLLQNEWLFEQVLFSESNTKCSQCNRIPNSYELVIFNDKTTSAVLHFVSII